MSARARDILEIENLQGRYMHLLDSGNFEDVRDLFAEEPDTTFNFADKNREPYRGKDDIYQRMFLERMCTSFPEYDRFHAGGQVVTPFIDVDDEGLHGIGIFPSFGYFVQGKIFGFDEPPYPTIINCGMWYHEFIKENGVWKFHHFHTGTLTDCKAWTWSPFYGEGYAELGIARQLPAPPPRREI